MEPSLSIGERLGNIYTGSLYASLLSVICNSKKTLKNSKIAMFSYGSGLASSLFFLKIKYDVKYISDAVNIQERLNNRVKISIEEYSKIMDLRES